MYLLPVLDLLQLLAKIIWLRAKRYPKKISPDIKNFIYGDIYPFGFDFKHLVNSYVSTLI